MRVIANRQLSGVYGRKVMGEEFECPDDIVNQLLDNDLVRPAAQPKVVYETKVIWPESPEVTARPPFRDGALHHEEPPRVAPESDQELPKPDVHRRGTAHRR